MRSLPLCTAGVTGERANRVMVARGPRGPGNGGGAWSPVG
ncbi:hypothetical protein ABIC27_003558 [Streptomyces sp. PvR034]